MPSCASPIQVLSETSGFRKKLSADLLTRAQWRSRSGVTPSNVRAPSKTMEPSHAACVRGPMIGTLPLCQSPSKNVQVFECTAAFVAGAGAATARLRVESPDPVQRARKFMAIPLLQLARVLRLLQRKRCAHGGRPVAKL